MSRPPRNRVEVFGNPDSIRVSLAQLIELKVIPDFSGAGDNFLRWELESEAVAEATYHILRGLLQGKEFIVRLDSR
jgi:hypothetical protein